MFITEGETPMKIEFDPANPAEVQSVLTLIGQAAAAAQPVQPVQPVQPAPAPGPQAAPAPGYQAPPPGYQPPAQQPAAASQADMGAAIQKLATAKGPKVAKALLGQLGFASTAAVPPEAFAHVIAQVEATLARG